MIPKIIHYVWVGERPLPKIAKQCISSWKKFCPDYEIIEWNNESLKSIDNQYVKEAFACKKWAFVSDYLRLYALQQHGGFYCDSDLRLFDSLDDFIKEKFVTGYELYTENVGPVTALMGAEKDSPIIADLLSDYDNISFLDENGEPDLTTNVTRISEYFKRNYGLDAPYDGTSTTVLEEACTIYPSYYFCTPQEGKPSYSQHLFNGSWVDCLMRFKRISLGPLIISAFARFRDSKGSEFPLDKGERLLLSVKLPRFRQKKHPKYVTFTYNTKS